MKTKKTFLSLFILLIGFTLNAQQEVISYSYERNSFGENAPLPSEQYWVINGNLPTGVNRVEIAVYSSDKIGKKRPVYMNKWEQGLAKAPNDFYIPINYKLRGNQNYSFTINYFIPIDEGQRSELQKLLDTTLRTYINQNISANKNSVEMRRTPTLLHDEMGKIMRDALKYYRSSNSIRFTSFSNIVLDKLVQLKTMKLNKAKYNVQSNNDTISRRDITISYFETQLQELLSLCKIEVSQFLNTDVSYRIDRRTILDYPSEKTTKSLAVNVGYGAVYKEGKFDNMIYGTSPYVGISIPLGNVAMHNNFMSKSAISFGVFVSKMKFSKNSEIGGPLIELPAYVAYGYKPVSFLRINAGITALQEKKNGTFDMNNIYVRPFIGIALEINLSASFR